MGLRINTSWKDFELPKAYLNIEVSSRQVTQREVSILIFLYKSKQKKEHTLDTFSLVISEEEEASEYDLFSEQNLKKQGNTPTSIAYELIKTKIINGWDLRDAVDE